MTTIIKSCFCGNEVPFEQCCQPIINGKVNAKSAEHLMRSRFTAYVIKDYGYILNTYASAQRAKLTIQQLADSAQETQWLSLQVISHKTQSTTAQVEFKAFYQFDARYHMMHELSNFIFESGKWLYTQGLIQKDSGQFTPQRNSQCLCGSGKKFKKCCAG